MIAQVLIQLQLFVLCDDKDPQQTCACRNRCRFPAPDLISAPGKSFVRRNGPLEVVVFLAGNQTKIFECRQ